MAEKAVKQEEGRPMQVGSSRESPLEQGGRGEYAEKDLAGNAPPTRFLGPLAGTIAKNAAEVATRF